MNSRLIDNLHRLLAKSPLGVWLALKLRNQAAAVLSASVFDGTSMRHNGEKWLLRKLSTEIRCFADIGANIGSWTKLALASSPNARGVAVEPSPSAFAALSSELSDDRRVRLIRCAVGDRTEEGFLSDPSNASEHASLVRAHGATSSSCRVDVVPLAEILDQAGFDRVDILKIDTEGFDGRILMGAASLLSTERVRVIQFEYNSMWREAGSTLTSVCRFLDGFGYSVWLLRETGLGESPLRRLGEYFSYSNYIAISAASLPSIGRLLDAAPPGTVVSR